MRKRILQTLLAAGLLLALTACSAQKAEIVMITDAGNVEDQSFNQGTWEGIRLYAGVNGKSCYYYQPASEEKADYLVSIDKAVQAGASIIFLPGQYFAETVSEAQELYPGVSFVILDAQPTKKPANNTLSITFAEEEGGFMAGYAAVKEGYTSLGFMGGPSVPGVIRFGLGFAQGANAAAREMEVNVTLRYAYTPSFSPNESARGLAAGWYADGVEVIFACGGEMGLSVFDAAEEAGTKAIGVDIDQSDVSETVIVSATKGLGSATGWALEEFYNGNFPGGEELTLGVSEGAMALSIDTSRMKNFSKRNYDELLTNISENQYPLSRSSKDGGLPHSPNDLDVSLTNLKVTLEDAG